MASRMESLPHDVMSLIMERLPAKSLPRFKAVSKQWRSTIESPFFQERQFKHRQQSGDPDVLMVSLHTDTVRETVRTLVLGSSSSVKIPTPRHNPYFVCQDSCDGLVCFYNDHVGSEPGFVFNPTTRWHRTLPLCKLQQFIIDLGNRYYKVGHGICSFGFGKDKFTGTYKPVYLYNSSEIGREDDATTCCEVFDFSTDSWRYVTPSAPYQILDFPDPAYVDGSLHWFTECQETKVVSFDLHTETFQVVSKAPFANAPVHEIVMCNLNNRLCVSLKKCSNQVIWSFNSNNKTWDQMCSIDLDLVSSLFNIPPIVCALRPLSLLDGEKKKKKLIFYDRVSHEALMTYDLETKSYDTAFSGNSIGSPLCYFPSLFSVS